MGPHVLSWPGLGSCWCPRHRLPLPHPKPVPGSRHFRRSRGLRNCEFSANINEVGPDACRLYTDACAWCLYPHLLCGATSQYQKASLDLQIRVPAQHRVGGEARVLPGQGSAPWALAAAAGALSGPVAQRDLPGGRECAVWLGETHRESLVVSSIRSMLPPGVQVLYYSRLPELL